MTEHCLIARLIDVNNPDLARNHILAALNGDEQALLARHSRSVFLAAGSVLIAPHMPIENAYFLTGGMASTCAALANGRSVQNDLTGAEGFVGIPLILGCNSVPNSTTRMQIAGSALRIDVAALRSAINRRGKLQLLLERYALSQLIRVMQSSICNRMHATEERLACWLLMTSDRVGPEFRATHEMMADMLGSRRVTLTLRAHELQQAGIIQYRYGRLRIPSRTRLERLACECYSIQRDEYDAFLYFLRGKI